MHEGGDDGRAAVGGVRRQAEGEGMELGQTPEEVEEVRIRSSRPNGEQQERWDAAMRDTPTHGSWGMQREWNRGFPWPSVRSSQRC